MSKVIIRSQQSWIPLTDDEVNVKIQEIINQEVKAPRPVSIVRFADN